MVHNPNKLKVGYEGKAVEVYQREQEELMDFNDTLADMMSKGGATTIKSLPAPAVRVENHPHI